MPKKPIAAVLLVVLVGSAFVVWHFWNSDPVEVADKFLEQIVEQNFMGIEQNFQEDEPHPEADQFEQGFQRFGVSFGLTQIELFDLTLSSQTRHEAILDFAISYASKHFSPLRIDGNLLLRRKGIFAPWKIVWRNNLPLPQSGLDAVYDLARLEARRANLVDRNGDPLALEGSLISVGIQPDRISDPERLLEALHDELNLDPAYVRRQYEREDVQGHWFVPLVKLAEQEYWQVESILRPIPGVFFRRESARSYPQQDSGAHLSGYLGEVTQEMIDANPQRDYQSGEVVGRSGLEYSQDDLLRGRPGYRFYVDLSDGERVLITEKPVVLGKNLTLTVDLDMQKLAFETLGDRIGALVVLDAESGGVLALASSPSFDPNEFSVGISSHRWQELSGDLKRPLFNRALQGLYPPGSVFKVVTAAAAIDQGLYDANSLFNDSGQLRVEGNIIRNFEQQIFGEHNLHQALVNSINTTLAQVGLDLGASRLEEYFRRWGLERSWPLGLPMQQGQLGQADRSGVALAWSSIGQDQVLLTPLHLAQIFSVFANEGRLAGIHLLDGMGESEETVVLKPETVEQINAMLRDAVLVGTGTAAQVSGLEVYGKTGTAEVAGGGVHAWFAGHVQVPEGTKLAFALLVEEGGVGGQTAAPLVSQFLKGLLL